MGIGVDINFIFKIAAIGLIVAVLYQILVRSGREEQATMTSLAGLIVVLFMIIQQISRLFDTVKSIFRL
jgi:stage III sporulation protein AC